MKSSCGGGKRSWEEGGGWLCLNFGCDGKEVCDRSWWSVDLCNLGKLGFPVSDIAVGVVGVEDPVDVARSV